MSKLLAPDVPFVTSIVSVVLVTVKTKVASNSAGSDPPGREQDTCLQQMESSVTFFV